MHDQNIQPNNKLLRIRRVFLGWLLLLLPSLFGIFPLSCIVGRFRFVRHVCTSIRRSRIYRLAPPSLLQRRSNVRKIGWACAGNRQLKTMLQRHRFILQSFRQCHWSNMNCWRWIFVFHFITKKTKKLNLIATKTVLLFSDINRRNTKLKKKKKK